MIGAICDAHLRLFGDATEPTATFYVWADISGLPEPLNDCLVFLEECAKRKVICVVRSRLPLGQAPSCEYL
jgi:aspartate/methionine/tyrosine aminotransferase